MTPEQGIMAELKARGVSIQAHGDRLRIVPASAVPDDLRDRIRAHRAALLALLAAPPAEQLEARAEREARRFAAVCRPLASGRGWTDPAAAGLAALLALADAYPAAPPADWAGPPPTLYDVDGQQMTFAQRAEYWRRMT